MIDRAGPRLHARWRQSPAAHPTPTASDAVASPPPAIDRPNRDRPRPATSRARGALAATRPRQWLKNLLVFAAPGAAGLLGRSAMLGRTAIAAGLFLVASAGTYLVNDAVDVAADRLHPEKSLRPVAAGVVDRSLALSFGGALLLLAIVGAAVFEPVLAVVIGAYVLTTTTYTLWLKRVAVIELACVSAGFVLRAVAGGVAVHIAISTWFAIVTSASALFIVAGKRSAEFAALGSGRASRRAVLAEYSANYLRSVRLLSATVAIVGYCLWAFERASHLDVDRPPDISGLLFRISIIPFVLGILIVELAFDSGKGAEPEAMVLHDRRVQIVGLLCAGLVAIGIYA